MRARLSAIVVAAAVVMSSLLGCVALADVHQYTEIERSLVDSSLHQEPPAVEVVVEGNPDAAADGLDAASASSRVKSPTAGSILTAEGVDEPVHRVPHPLETTRHRGDEQPDEPEDAGHNVTATDAAVEPASIEIKKLKRMCWQFRWRHFKYLTERQQTRHEVVLMERIGNLQAQLDRLVGEGQQSKGPLTARFISPVPNHHLPMPACSKVQELIASQPVMGNILAALDAMIQGAHTEHDDHQAVIQHLGSLRNDLVEFFPDAAANCLSKIDAIIYIFRRLQDVRREVKSSVDRLSQVDAGDVLCRKVYEDLILALHDLHDLLYWDDAAVIVKIEREERIKKEDEERRKKNNNKTTTTAAGATPNISKVGVLYSSANGGQQEDNADDSAGVDNGPIEVTPDDTTGKQHFGPPMHLVWEQLVAEVQVVWRMCEDDPGLGLGSPHHEEL